MKIVTRLLFLIATLSLLDKSFSMELEENSRSIQPSLQGPAVQSNSPWIGTVRRIGITTGSVALAVGTGYVMAAYGQEITGSTDEVANVALGIVSGTGTFGLTACIWELSCQLCTRNTHRPSPQEDA